MSSESQHWSDSVTHQTWNGPLPQSANDDRQYRLIQLNNGLQAMLISDASTDKSAIACNVGVGAMSDSWPGIAHAIEHCKFLGTEKYPSENAYKAFLSANGGRGNAYTSKQNTGYFLEVNPAALEGAIDRFAQFFIAPLFAEESIERQMKAVDSEHKKNLQQDTRRAYQLSKHLSKDGHPYRAFFTGDFNTLYADPKKKGFNPREEFLKWHAENYSANIMAVAVVGNKSLKDLEQLIVSNFSTVKNRELPRRRFDPDLWGPDEKATLVFQQSVADIRTLSVTFVCPNLQTHIESRPQDILAHLMNHEGPGSLCAHLREFGLVNSVAFDENPVGNDLSILSVEMDLTEEGLIEYKKLVSALFSYIDLIKTDLDRESTFDEIKAISRLNFSYKEKSQDIARFVDSMSRNMLKDWPRERLLDGSVARTWEPEIFERILESLTPANCRITISATKPPPDLPAPDKVEPIYNSKYSYNKIEPSFLAALNAPPKIAELKMPLPNPYIPTNLDVLAKKKSKCPLTEPALIYSDKYCELYHKTDDRWLVPRANVKIQFFNPQMSETVEDVVKSALVVELLKDKLAVETYDAKLAGLTYSILSLKGFIYLEMSGYNDKMLILLQSIIKVSRTINLTQTRFNLAMDKLVRAWQNHKFSPPYKLVRDAHAEFTRQDGYEKNVEAKLLASGSITVEQVQNHLGSMFTQSCVKILAHGNLDQESSMSIAQTLLKEYILEYHSNRSQLCGQYPPHASNTIVKRNLKNIEEPNSAIYLTSFVCLYEDIMERCKNSLYIALVKEPFFNTMRTKEQLGYIVQASSLAQFGTIWTAFLIQSERDTSHLHNRIQQFLTTFREFLSAMSEETFNITKDSPIANLRENPKNLADETKRLWDPISQGFNDFNDREDKAKLLGGMTKIDMLCFHDMYLQNPNGNKRLVLHWDSISKQEDKAADSTSLPSAEAAGAEFEASEEVEMESQIINYESADYVEFLASLSISPQPADVKTLLVRQRSAQDK